jgi:predicted O-methyltransferase YrrM
MTDWRQIHGCFTFAPFYDWIAEYIDQYEWHGVEVGALYGQSAAYMLEQLSKNWTPGCVHRFDVVELSDNSSQLRANLGDKVTIHSPMSSVDASKLYADASLDFVMIDADHSYEGVRSDIDAWLPKLKVGGILAGHDFAHYFPGVIRAVLESFDRVELFHGTEWPDEHVAMDQRRNAAEQDFRNRSARGGPKDYLATWWVRKV